MCEGENIMNQEELKELHSQEIDVLRVFSVMTAAHLNEDGVSRIRFAIANNDGNALRFLDNGEILQGIAKTEKGKKCFRLPPNKYKDYYAWDGCHYILEGNYVTCRLFKKHFKRPEESYSETLKKLVEEYNQEAPITMQPIEDIKDLPYDTVDGNGEKRRCEHDKRRWESVYKDYFNNMHLNSQFVADVYASIEQEFNKKPQGNRLTIKVETLLTLQNQMDKAIEDSKAFEMQPEQVQARKAAEKAEQAKLQEKIKKEEAKKLEEAKKQDPFYNF